MVERAFALNEHAQTLGTVIYWMSRDQRVDDNWALLYAQSKALEMNQGLMVVFCKINGYLGATEGHDGFMMEGLHHVFLKLKEYSIPFAILEGDPVETITAFIQGMKAGLLVTDFNPLKISRSWKMRTAGRMKVRFVEVDAHNVIPCFTASNKQEFAAHTFRPKVHRMMDDFLTEYPEMVKHPFHHDVNVFDLSPLHETTYRIFENIHNKYRIQSGEDAAKQQLNDFIGNRLNNYENRNDPNEEACSGLSPYLHFGQISAQRVALAIIKETGASSDTLSGTSSGTEGMGSIDSASDFLEELIVRRELSDNFCYYNQNYDNLEGFPSWARKTLQDHRSDPREYLYDIEPLENAATHDKLWNAAQMEMVKTGKMHGYLRMYWAKKILEWSETVEGAVQNAIYLNDRYQLDGRDPNGYTGIAWSIGGVHDRAWGERSVFGKIRYMSYNGCKRKFDVDKYIRKMADL